jgi:pilus assembly protein TadC
MGLIMRRIQRIEKLERRVERIFFGITMALLIFVLLCILIVARKSFGTSQVNSGNLPSQSHG